MSGTYKFRAKVWFHEGPGGWHFITLPKKVSGEIKAVTAGLRRGWGSLRVEATIGKARWMSSIFPDSKRGAYLLPVNKEVRAKAGN